MQRVSLCVHTSTKKTSVKSEVVRSKSEGVSSFIELRASGTMPEATCIEKRWHCRDGFFYATDQSPIMKTLSRMDILHSGQRKYNLFFDVFFHFVFAHKFCMITCFEDFFKTLFLLICSYCLTSSFTLIILHEHIF